MIDNKTEKIHWDVMNGVYDHTHSQSESKFSVVNCHKCKMIALAAQYATAKKMKDRKNKY